MTSGTDPNGHGGPHLSMQDLVKMRDAKRELLQLRAEARGLRALFIAAAIECGGLLHVSDVSLEAASGVSKLTKIQVDGGIDYMVEFEEEGTGT
jgi:hypothetical protein